MKKTICFVLAFVGILIVACNNPKKDAKSNPVEGAWKLAFAKWTMYEQTFPTQIQGGSLRIYSKGYYVFDGRLQLDTIVAAPSGGGSYTLEGDRFEELIMYQGMSKSSMGTKIRFLLEVRNDTLIQRWPVDDNWKLSEKYNIEKYIRIE